MAEHAREIAHLLTEDQAAQLLGLSGSALRAWRQRGRGPRYLRINRTVRYREADVRAFLDASVVDPTTGLTESDHEARPAGLTRPTGRPADPDAS